MKKSFLFGIIFMLGVFLIGCSMNESATLPDDKLSQTSIENENKPSLVFFFTGVE